jgi:hypothetical protein
MNETMIQGKTRRSPDGAFASVGAVRQSGGSLPIYICNGCGDEVVWATSQRTGRKYLARVHHGYLGQRFYVAASLHDCAKRRSEIDAGLWEASWKIDNDHHFAYLFHLMDEHDEQGHPVPVESCRRCERELALGIVRCGHEECDGEPCSLVGSGR